MGNTESIQTPVIWPGEWDDDMILSYLITIEKKRISRQKRWKIEPWSQDWFDLRIGWLTQKWRILNQNGRC